MLATTLLVAVVTSLVMRGYLNGQLDDQVQKTAGAVGRPLLRRPARPGSPTADGDAPRFGRGDAAGTLSAQFDRRQRRAARCSPTSGHLRTLSTTALHRLEKVPVGRRVHTWSRCPASGPSGCAPPSDSQATAGRRAVRRHASTTPSPTWCSREVADRGWRPSCVALGAGLVLVRRQLRPLREVAATAHEVAALPLSQRRDRHDRAGARDAHRRADRGRRRSAPPSTRCSRTSSTHSTSGTAVSSRCGSSSPTPPTSCGRR